MIINQYKGHTPCVGHSLRQGLSPWLSTASVAVAGLLLLGQPLALHAADSSTPTTSQTTHIQAREVTVRGTVKDQLGDPLTGASITIKGVTGKGATADLDGNFELAGVPVGSTITVSYIGMKAQSFTITAANPRLEIVLEDDAYVFDAVVVTALGIKRSEKALSYNVQELKGEELLATKDANFLNSLTGKVAGLNINASSTGVGGATKVVMRGTKSIDGSNNALYVIDGVPMFSTTSKQGTGRFESAGSTESMADINPDNIASISVLTGASAAALYGSAAANGAILITTKQGEAGVPKVSYTTTLDWGTPLLLPQFQSRYGNDGQITSWGNALPEGVKGYDAADFFNTAFNQSHTVTLSGGTDKNRTFASAAYTHADGLVPNNAYKRYNVTLRNSTSLLADRLHLDFGIDYINQSNRNFINQGEYMNPIAAAYLMPRGETNEGVRNYERYNMSNKTYVQNWQYGNGDFTLQNPYWVAYRNLRETQRERYILTFNTNYDIIRWDTGDKWDIKLRVRTDNTQVLSTDKRYGSTTATLSPLKNGYYGETKGTERQTYGDLISTLNKAFEVGEQRLTLSATLGASIQDTRYDSSKIEGPLKNNGIPNLFNIFNIDQFHSKTNMIPEGYIEQTQSIFGSLEAGLNSYLFLTVTGRNDWASQLAGSKHSSFFYPSVGLSMLPIEMLSEEQRTAINPVLSLLRIRASYASVASPFQRGLTTPTFQMDLDNKVYKTLSFFPVGDLRPERTNSFEAGISTQWWQGLLSLDATYYQTNTYNQTIFSEVPSASGYTGIYIQTGNVRNRGVELALGLHIGDDKGVRFDSDFTLGYNHNEIINLAEHYVNPITQEVESQSYLEKGTVGNTLSYILQRGGTLGDLYTSADFKRDAHGRILVAADGSVQMAHFADDQRIRLGSVLPDFTLGWSNEISYRGLRLGATLTGRTGGIVVSMTEAALDYYGVSAATADARDRGYVMVDGLTIDPQSYYTVRGKERLGQYYTYDASNVRLSDLHIGYTLPRKYIGGVADITLNLYGRNLAFLYKKAPFDPEAVSSTGNYAQGIDYFMLPSMRTLGFSLKLNF